MNTDIYENKIVDAYINSNRYKDCKDCPACRTVNPHGIDFCAMLSAYRNEVRETLEKSTRRHIRRTTGKNSGGFLYLNQPRQSPRQAIRKRPRHLLRWPVPRDRERRHSLQIPLLNSEGRKHGGLAKRIFKPENPHSKIVPHGLDIKR